MKICLINPPLTCLKKDIVPIIPPIGLACLAATLRRAGHEAVVLDTVLRGRSQPLESGDDPSAPALTRYGLSARELQEELRRIAPDAIGISNNMAANERDAVEVARNAKACLPGVPIIVGGTNATARAKALLADPAVDYVVAGEGDEILVTLLDRLATGQGVEGLGAVGWRTPDGATEPRERAYIRDLDQLPMPAWDLLDMPAYLERPFPFVNIARRNAVMVTSRGCVYNCVFCSGRDYLGRWRTRSLDLVREEIQFLKRQYGIQSLHFMDANINANERRFVELCGILEAEKMPWNPIGGLFIRTLTPSTAEIMIRSGTFHLTLAVEHGNTDIQKYIGKPAPLDKVRDIVAVASRHGIWTHASFIIGFPHETREQALECLSYAKESGVDSISVYTATPLPGSRLYNEVSAYASIDPDDMRFLADQSFANCLAPAELAELRGRIFSDFVSHKIRDNLLRPWMLIRKLTANRFVYARVLLQSLRRYLLLRAT